MMTCYTISATKANLLYWLGRYAERVYISLHLLRRYYDKMIDGLPEDYEGFYEKLDANNPYPDMESFRLGYMYDDKNPCSLISGLTAAYDNAVVLREEITSETFSYIELSLNFLRKSAEKKDANITDLQLITDYLLAFWGSVDERVFNEQVYNILKIGKLVENIDIHIRFDYPFFRIKEAYESLIKCGENEEELFDHMIEKHLGELLVEDVYDLYHVQNMEYKAKLLKYLNHLVLL